MIKLNNNKQLEEPIIDVLYDLRRDLLKQGINKLNEIIVKGPNALITCPIHSDGQEKHPSCNVRLTDGDRVSAGVAHCFTCHYKANLPTLISDCFGYDDGGDFGKKWLMEHCRYSYLTERRELGKVVPITTIKKENKKEIFVSEEELASYRVFHPYMFQRKLTEEVIKKFDIGFDRKTNCITFPVYNVDGNCLFIVKRCVDFKKFYIPPNAEKEIFGLNQIPKDCNEVVICESVFNALTCWVYGKVGIALFGTGSHDQIKTLKELPIRKYILAFDGDTAGRRAEKWFRESLQDTKLVRAYHLPEGKDINDLTQEEFLNLTEF